MLGRLAAFANTHLKDLFSHCDFALEVDFNVSEVETTIVAGLDAVKGLLVKKSLDFVLVLLKLSGFRELFSDLRDEFVIDLQFFVVQLKFLKFSLCALLV
jgi:hypothetical protein